MEPKLRTPVQIYNSLHKAVKDQDILHIYFNLELHKVGDVECEENHKTAIDLKHNCLRSIFHFKGESLKEINSNFFLLLLK